MNQEITFHWIINFRLLVKVLHIVLPYESVNFNTCKCSGDYIAFYPCGAYGSSMSSNHCMRGGSELKEVLLKDSDDEKKAG